MNSFFNSVMAWFVGRRLHEISYFTQHPKHSQMQVWNNLLYHGMGTAFGKDHAFYDIKTLNDFKKNIPIRSYEQLKTYIDRSLNGEQNVLWNTNIEWFAKSSGTTDSRSKFIPVTKESMNDTHFKGGKDAMSLYYQAFPHSKLFTGKCLIMGGSLSTFNNQSNIHVGDVSAVMMQNMPWVGQWFKAPDLETLLMDEWESKLEKIIKLTRNENITHIAGVPSWTMVLLKKMLAEYQCKSILDIWPNLELYLHGGVSFSPYKSQFDNLFSDKKINYWQTYNASEGFFALQQNPNEDDMLLMLDYGVYYEFQPLDNNDKTLTIEEVSLHTPYSLIISTNAGLWRYQLGDVVIFTSLKPYKIKILGRTKAFINACGEELMVDNADMALAETSTNFNIHINEYTAAPHFEGNKKVYHEWIIESPNVAFDTENFAQELDLMLRKLNSDYDAKRHKNLALDLLKITWVKEGTFYNWMQQKGKLGGQNKVPRLSNNRDHVDSLNEFLLQFN